MCFGFSCEKEEVSNNAAEKGCGANVIDGTDPPGKSGKGEDRVYVEGELCGISTCACEHGHKSVDSSDLVEYLGWGIRVNV